MAEKSSLTSFHVLQAPESWSKYTTNEAFECSSILKILIACLITTCLLYNFRWNSVFWMPIRYSSDVWRSILPGKCSRQTVWPVFCQPNIYVLQSKSIWSVWNAHTLCNGMLRHSLGWAVCWIFWQAFGSCASKMLVQICFFNIFNGKKLKNNNKARNLQQNSAKKCF